MNKLVDSTVIYTSNSLANSGTSIKVFMKLTTQKKCVNMSRFEERQFPFAYCNIDMNEIQQQKIGRQPVINTSNKILF